VGLDIIVLLEFADDTPAQVLEFADFDEQVAAADGF
jgi:hypothetical protein